MAGTPTQCDVFSDYCFQSYFLNDPRSLAYEPKVFERFGHRAVTRIWRMTGPAGQPKGKHVKYSLPGLACRYYRFFPSVVKKRLTVRVFPSSEKASAALRHLKAEIGFALPESGLCLRVQGEQPLRVKLTSDSNGDLVGEFEKFSKHCCDHAVLVVTNCDHRPKIGQFPPSGFVHQTDFCIEASLS